MNDAIPTNNVSAKKVTTGERNTKLWPASYVIGSVDQLEWEVPYDSVVGLHRLVSMLAHSGLVA